MDTASFRRIEGSQSLVGNEDQHWTPIPGFRKNLEMVELLVDSHPSFHDKMNATTKFGGNLSVGMPPNNRPLICFGQK
jgi:hypothetical protein